MEILVVITIIALLAAIVPLAYSRFVESAQYRQTVRAALTDMRHARQLAMAQGVQTRFVVDLGAHSFGVVDGPLTTVPPSLTMHAVMAEQESSSGAPGQLMSIVFLPRGGASGGSLDLVRPSGIGVRLRVDWFTGRVEQEQLGHD